MNYFSHDYNARNDRKMVKLKVYHKMQGLGIYWSLIEMLYEEGGKLLFADLEIISDELRCDPEVVKSVIKDFDLFEYNKKHFWSDSVLKRLDLRVQKSKSAQQSAIKRWSNKPGKEDLSERNANASQETSECNAIKESKVKESKRESIEERALSFHKSVAEFTQTYPKQMLRSFYDYWTEKNPAGVKMKYEMEKTFEVSKRLATWASREKDYKQKPKEQNHTSYSVAN